MIPKKAKDMMRGYAEQKGIPYSHNEIMLIEYWKEVKKMLRELEAPRVRVRGLGTFEIKGWEVHNEMRRHQRLVTSVPIMRRGPHIDNLERLENIYDMLNEELQEQIMKKEARKIERNGTKGEDDII